MQRVVLVLAAFCLLTSPAFAQGDSTMRPKVELDDQDCPNGDDRFCIQPRVIEVEEGSDVVLRIENIGRVNHNVSATNQTPESIAKHIDVPPLEPNETVEVSIPWTAFETAREAMEGQNVTLACGFDGHAALGERLTLVIGGAETENPQPALGTVATLGLVGLAAVAWRRARG